MAIMPPPPGSPMPGPAMGAPGMSPMGAPEGDNTAPAGQMMAPLALLAQQQQGALSQLHQQEMMMKEAMRQQIIRLISMMPMANPAGMAARTEPLPPSMGAEDPMGASAPMSDQVPAGQDMGSAPNAY
ncbi:hypothetical protein UFOVP929_34 [uncultured Caudovirales phage]|uniref:Uncharacterized protein n=1 Tax=uncultured Caudovirales phage TaxID=2100421 RepID=A0A6J5PPP4_9CAUD|nr:hypothetical protein UFOVP929_34 [uncultured Caudovirales phage]